MITDDGSKRTALEAAQANGDLSGKVFLVTGAYSGIGVETTKALLAMNGKVIVGGRNAKMQQEFVEKLEKEGYDKSLVDGNAVVDLGDLQTVKEFADYVRSKYDKLDCLILNAGVAMTPPGVTKDGFETQFGINVIGHFLLAKLLLPIMTPDGRQVWLSSSAHELNGSPRVDIEYYRNFNPKTSKYDPMLQYQQSKLADILLAKEFGKRHGIEAVSVHPGVINTNLGRYLSFTTFIRVAWHMIFSGKRVLYKTAEQGAAPAVTCATLPSDKLANGAYYADCQVKECSESANNEEDAAAVYDYCDEVTQKFQE